MKIKPDDLNKFKASTISKYYYKQSKITLLKHSIYINK